MKRQKQNKLYLQDGSVLRNTKKYFGLSDDVLYCHILVWLNNLEVSDKFCAHEMVFRARCDVS